MVSGILHVILVNRIKHAMTGILSFKLRSQWLASAHVCAHVWPTSVCVTQGVQGPDEEMESMIPQSSTSRLRRCGYCLLQVTSRCQLPTYIHSLTLCSCLSLTCVIAQQICIVKCLYQFIFCFLANSDTDFLLLFAAFPHKKALQGI